MKLAPLYNEYSKANQKKAWTDDCEKFVGFADIMGFKDLVARKPHDEIKHMFLQMHQTRNILLNLLGNSLSEKSKEEVMRVKSVSFSDSVLFVTRSDTPKDLFNLSVALGICQEATIQSAVPTKGAISHGMLTADFERSIFFGQPIIDAYLLQEQLHYYGIIVDNNAEAKLKIISKDKHKDFPYNHFLNIQTPLKSGNVSHFNIRLKNIQDDQLDDLYNSVSGQARKYVDNTINVYKMMNEVSTQKT